MCVCPLSLPLREREIYIYICSESRSVKDSLSRGLCVCLSEGWGSSCHSHPFNEVRGHGLPQWLVDYVVDKATPYWLANCLERRHFARWDDSWKLSRNKQEENRKDLAFRARKIGKKSKERHTRETLTVRKTGSSGKENERRDLRCLSTGSNQAFAEFGLPQDSQLLSHVWRGSPERTVRVAKSDKASLSPMQSRRMPLQDELPHTVQCFRA